MMSSPGRLSPVAQNIFAPQVHSLGTGALWFTVFLSSGAMFGDCARDGKSRKEQITMIAQKIVEAKHAEQQRCRFITPPDTRAFTLGTTRPDHFRSLFFRLRFGEEEEDG